MESTPEADPLVHCAGVADGLRWLWLGEVAYSRALAFQEKWLREHAERGDCLLLLEHPSTYTTGRGGSPENLPLDPSVPVERIGRGGDVTWHGPGQLVGYPILDLRRRGSDVHRYLRVLEDGILAFLANYGVRGCRVEGRTGVWVERPEAAPRKIASIGIGVRRGISWHGFAVNLASDLGAFDAIVPCGIEGVEMTSIEREGRPPPRGRNAAEAMVEVLAPLLAPL